MKSKRLFGLICYVHRQMSRENNVLLSEYGLSHIQMHTLFYIDRCKKSGKEVCQRDVENLLNLRPSSISSMLTNLEKDGFIVRTVSQEDARSKIICLTEKSQTFCDKNRLIIDSYDKDIESALNEEEQEKLKELLNKIICSIQEHREVKDQ